MIFNKYVSIRTMFVNVTSVSSQTDCYLFKFNKGNDGRICEICSKLTIKTQEEYVFYFPLVDVGWVYLWLSGICPQGCNSCVEARWFKTLMPCGNKRSNLPGL